MTCPTPNLRHLFEQISLSVVSFLENHRGVDDVQFFERSGAERHDILQWHTNNSPFHLPEDLVNFLTMSDGILLRWNLKYNGELLPLGCMHLNAISQIKPLNVGDMKMNSNICRDEGEKQGKFYNASYWANPVAAFDIDSMCLDGRVAIIYKEGYENPSIWFQDLSCQWWFVADSFTDYMRLLVMHLGLPHWQYAFTEVGLDPTAKQWLRFMAPERLAIDLDKSRHSKTRTEDKNALNSSSQGKLNLAQIDTLARNSTKSRSSVKKKNVGHSGGVTDNQSLSATMPISRKSRPGSAPHRRQTSDRIARSSTKGIRPDTALSKRRK